MPGTLPTPPRHAGPHRAVLRRGASSAQRVFRLKTPCESNQACVIPTPLAIVLGMCQGPLRLLPSRFACFCGSVALSQLPSPRACSLEAVLWYTHLLEIPISHWGLKTHKPMPMSGVPSDCYQASGELTFVESLARAG